MESTSKAEFLRETLDTMSLEQIAQFLERRNLQDELISEHHQVTKWKTLPVDCRAPCINDKGETIDLNGEVCFLPNDDFYSCQG